MDFISKNLIWFMVYSFMGWIYESTLRSITHKRLYNSGFLNGPYIPIYGCGALLDVHLLNGLKDPLTIFLLAGVINCVLEYFTSWAMEKLFHARWWAYSNKPLNLNGRIYYLGFLAFGTFATLVVLYFHPWLVIHTTDRMSYNLINGLAVLIVVIIVTDTYITVSNMEDFKEKYAALVASLGEAKSELAMKMEDLPYADRIAKLRESFNFQERRLLDAFPHLRFENARYTAQQIKAMIIEHTKQLFRS